MYEIRKTDKDRFAVRPENAVGMFVLGTGIIIDSHISNIAVYENKNDAFLKAKELNRSASELFNNFIDKDESSIADEINNQSSIIEKCKKNIEVLNCVMHCKYNKERC